MKISYNTLKSYLNIPLSVQEIGNILTEIGLEVEDIEKIGNHEADRWNGLIVAEVQSAIQHPNADRLRITQVNTGTEILQIVCGAPNVAAGQKVVLATIGTTLYPQGGEPFKIKKSKIRGEESNGMICAADEIGIGDDHSGILVLDENAVVGQAAQHFLNIPPPDTLITIGLTPNRSDAGAYIGIVKDVAAYVKTRFPNQDIQLKLPDTAHFEAKAPKTGYQVIIKDKERCTRYCGVLIKNVHIAPSPTWLQEHLTTIGIHPINNIVDITNFVLQESGQPLHAFDAAAIAEKTIIVQTLPQNTPFVALDGTERRLQAGDLMICDGNNNPLCIAGVFGGKASGVSEQTQDIFLESACFDAVSVRKTAKYHNLRTEAAQRFEKGADANSCLKALQRAALLIQEIAGGTITADIIDEYPQVVAKVKVKVRYEQVRKLAGTPDISNAMIEHILSALEMDIVARETADSVTVAVPTNKVDVTREVDVIEEILRIYGYNNMSIPQAIYATLTPSPSPDVPALRETVATTLTARGFSEIMNNSLTNSQYYGHHQADTVTLLNSLNKNLDVLRKDLVRGALEAVRHNLNYKNTNCRFFEFGKVYHRSSDTTYTETEQLLILMSGSEAESWQQKSRAYQFFDLKQHLQYLWQRLALQPDMGTVFESELLEYGIGYYSDRHLLAEIGAVHTELLEQFDIPQPVYAAIVQWDNIVAARRQYAFTFKPLPKFPSVRRDLALLLDKTVSYAQLEKAVYQQAPPYLQEINIFDLYEDEQKIGAGKKSYALSFVLQAVDKTLTDADIDTAMKKILEILVKEFGIIQR